MEQYEVNKHVLRISWFYLLLWVLAAGAFIILLAMGNPYWFFPIPGLVFLYLWFMLATLYPKGIIIGEDSVAVSMMGSDKVRVIKFKELQVDEKDGYYELAVARNGLGRKYLVTKKSISPKLDQLLQRLIEQPLWHRDAPKYN